MKRLITQDISLTNGFPIKKGTLEFIQDAFKENAEDVIKSIISIIGGGYVSNTMYRLYGCEFTYPGSLFNHPNAVTAGAVFYNGEIFRVDATSITYPPFIGNGLNTRIIETDFTTDADPVTFTDGIPRNVHRIRKIKFEGSLSVTPPPLGITTSLTNPVMPVDFRNSWKSGGNASIGTVTGSISNISTIYNRYKLEFPIKSGNDLSSTLYWKLRMQFDITGNTTTLYSFTLPPDLTTYNLSFTDVTIISCMCGTKMCSVGFGVDPLSGVNPLAWYVQVPSGFMDTGTNFLTLNLATEVRG